MSTTVLITGATGFVGSHVAEACKARGYEIRALARSSSKTDLLQQLGASIIPGDMTDAESLRKAADGVDVVIHCAAKVGDWGPVEDYRIVNVDALRVLLDACKGRPLQRFIHMSSLGVYAARDHHGTTEEEPLPAQHMDGYTQTKVESERLVMDYYRNHKLPVVVLRPGFIYGPRDRTVLPRIMEAMRTGQFRYLGSGDKAMNCIYVGNLVDATFLVVDKPNAVGQIYNLTDGEMVSKRRFMEAVADGAGTPRPTRKVPLWLAKLAAWIMERRARRKGAREAPRLTQARIKFLGLNLDFSIEKAKRELGYQPRVNFDQAMKETMAWYRENR